MSDALQILKHEISRRQAEIEALQKAVDVLTGSEASTPKPLSSSAKQERGSGGTLTVNGVDVDLTAREMRVATALEAAGDCVPAAELAPLTSGNNKYLQTCIWVLNKKLRPAGAEIVHFKGEGYRLQNIEETT